jgi:hypothetical protein
MIPFRFHLSERTQVALILLLTLGALFATWYFLLRPQYRMNQEIAMLRKQLAASKYAHETIPGLRQAVVAENARIASLEQEWAGTAERLATFAFTNQAAMRPDEVGRIDYKVQLFNTRKNLLDTSDKLGIPLIPTDLGIDDALSSRDNVRIRERWLQLKAVERLVELTLDRHIERLTAVSPLPPVVRKARDGKKLFTEYPVRAEFDIGFDNLYTLFQSVFEENRVFAFRNIRVESGKQPNATVRVTAVMSALVFE